MINYCEVEINQHSVGVLFGVRLFSIIEKEELPINDNPNDAMNLIYMIYAGIKNNFDFEKKECNLTVKDVYLWANEDKEGFEKVCECLNDSRVLGNPIEVINDNVKKKTKKKSLLGQLFAKIV